MNASWRPQHWDDASGSSRRPPPAIGQRQTDDFPRVHKNIDPQQHWQTPAHWGIVPDDELSDDLRRQEQNQSSVLQISNWEDSFAQSPEEIHLELKIFSRKIEVSQWILRMTTVWSSVEHTASLPFTNTFRRNESARWHVTGTFSVSFCLSDSSTCSMSISVPNSDTLTFCDHPSTHSAPTSQPCRSNHRIDFCYLRSLHFDTTIALTTHSSSNHLIVKYFLHTLDWTVLEPFASMTTDVSTDSIHKSLLHSLDHNSASVQLSAWSQIVTIHSSSSWSVCLTRRRVSSIWRNPFRPFLSC